MQNDGTYGTIAYGRSSRDNADGLDDAAHDIAAQAWAAWEAAVCWDDEHAVTRLANVRAV